MKHASIDYIYILGTVLFTVLGQLMLKWRIAGYGSLPGDFTAKLLFLVRVLIDPFIIAGFFAAFVAGLCWMAAMTKFELSFAYPFMSLAFVLVFLLSVVLFQETVTMQKIIGLLLIVAGIIVTSKSV